ncbi:hypothetical protein BGHDH14_bgh05390 [Blumeria hordei DH14]|uniref:Uncharacterized protein n=1 Tax=Blumeria graminis f. sp. hordei (strain DH14) TaxID=546991 RepID=N1JHQ0_BLUG1|nr:hypothetical protein BGHDH14_bgh05390 [Blumeria hordei DH14]
MKYASGDIFSFAELTLQQNGEITDPPVATDSPAPIPVRYATSRAQPSTAPPTQYHVDVDIDQHEVGKDNDAYRRFRNDLEKRYPQVCEDCEPGALQRMAEAEKTAKADYLRRLIEKTKENRFNKSQEPLFSFNYVGKLLWNLGLYGQLFWNFTTLTLAARNSSSDVVVRYSIVIEKSLQPLTNLITYREWARAFLICTLLSTWWCPKSNGLSRDILRQLFNFSKWFQLQILVVILRCFFYWMMGTQFFSDINSPSTIGAHVAMSILTVVTAFKLGHATKNNHGPLWKKPTEKRLLTTRAQSLDEGSESIGDILDHIARSSSIQTTSPSVHIPLPSLRKNINHNNNEQAKYQNEFNNSHFDPVKNSQHTTGTGFSGIKAVTATSSINRFRDIRANNPQTAGISEHIEANQVQDETEEMDWQLTQPQHIQTFQPRSRALPEVSHPVSLTTQQPTFWYKLPAAPVPPAARLRHSAMLASQSVAADQTTSQFFSHRHSVNADLKPSETTNPQSELPLSQQTFFPPERSSEAGTVLADLLTAFSLHGTDDKGRAAPKRAGYLSLVHAMTLAVSVPVVFGVIFAIARVLTTYYTQYFNHPSEGIF